MITKASMEIAHTVKTASSTRRPMYASMGKARPAQRPERVSRARTGPGLSSLVLPVESGRARDARRLAVRTVVHARGDVAQVVLHHAHAHGGRPLADHADDVDLLGGDLPDVLAELDSLLLGYAERLLPLLHQLFHPGLGLLALGAVGVEPLHVERPRRGDSGQLEREHVEREGEEMLAAVVVPRGELLLVGGRALEREASLDLLHLQIDSDLLPLLPDHLGDLRVLHELPAERHDLDAQTPLAVATQPVALCVFLRQPDLVEHLVGLLQIEGGPELPVLRTRVVLVVVGGHDGARGAGAEPERLVDLVAVDAER